MGKHRLVALALGLAGAAQAQDSTFGVSLGLKAWNTEWTTFGNDTNDAGDPVITQVPARDKVVVLPLLSLRYGDFMASFSGYLPTEHRFLDGSSNVRKEFDAHAGYFVLPGLAVTLGYKQLAQTGDFVYRPRGPVLGLSATAPLAGGFTLYGAFGVGWLKTPAPRDKRDVEFDADYRLTELGLAYNLPVDRFAKALTFTLGYRTQVLSSKDALQTDGGRQDARDLTQGLTVGLVASF